MTIDAYRQQLLAAGFHEATRMPGRFYRQDTEWTAFALNMREQPNGVALEYGWASTAFTRMDGPNALAEWGCLTINLHEMQHGSVDPAPIQALYNAHRGIDKDALLALVTQRRKALIAAVAQRMKPLGFRKKASTWTRPLDETRLLTLHVQKSAYADAFYFNLTITPIAPLAFQAVGCYSERVPLNGEQCLDWQSLGEAAMTAYLDEQLLPALRRLLDTPPQQLCREPGMGTACVRERCQRCWLEEIKEVAP